MSCGGSEINDAGRCAEREQQAQLEDGLDCENPSAAISNGQGRPPTPAFDEVVSSASDQTQTSTDCRDSELTVCPSSNPDHHFKSGLAQPTTQSINVNNPMQASAYDYLSTDTGHNQFQSLPSLNAVTNLPTSSDYRKQATGYDYSFDFSVDSSGDLAQHAAPIFAMAASEPTDFNNRVHTSGYDYSHNFFANASSNLVQRPAHTDHQTTSLPIYSSDLSQDSGYNYSFEVTADSYSNLARHSFPSNFSNRTQASRNDEIHTFATYSSGNQS